MQQGPMMVGADELDRIAGEMGIGAEGDGGSGQPRQIQLLGFSNEGAFREWPMGLSPALAIGPGTRKEMQAVADRRIFLQSLELYTLGDQDAEIFPVASALDLLAVTNITLNGVRSFLGSGFMAGRAFTPTWGFKTSYYGMVDSNGPVVVEVLNIGDTLTVDVSGDFYGACAKE